MALLRTSVGALGGVSDVASNVQDYFSANTSQPVEPGSEAMPTCGNLFSSLQSPSWNFHGFDPLSACRAGYLEHEDDDEVEFDDMLAPPPEQAQKYTLRMCVHSGRNLPKERLYVVVTISKVGVESVQRFESPVAAESRAPVWEFCFDTTVEVGPDVPRVELKVYHKQHVLGDRFMGGATLPLSSKPTVPRTQLLKLAGMPSPIMGWTPPHGKLTVVWQLCESTRGEPDLMRVAEMGPDASERSTCHIDVRVLRLSLARPTHGSTGVVAKVHLIDKAEQKVKRGKTSQAMTRPTARNDSMLDEVTMGATAERSRAAFRGKTPEERSMRGGAASAAVIGRDSKKTLTTEDTSIQSATSAASFVSSAELQAELCPEAVWPEETGQLEQWTLLNESQVSLMRYRLHIAVYRCDERGTEHLIGSWREPLPDLQDAVEELGQRLCFDAQLIKDGDRQGLLRIELDIFQNVPHQHREVKTAVPTRTVLQSFGSQESLGNSLPAPGVLRVPLRRGQLPNWESDRPVLYYCTIWADGLPMDGSASNPYIRITMGGQRSETARGKQDGYINDVKWWEPVRVSTKAGERKARIEVWNDNSFLPVGFRGQDTLIGQATIYDVAPGQMYWRFLFGGAVGARNKAKAALMVKGAISPASTCHGLVCVHFGGRPMPSPHHFDRLKSMRLVCKLNVRLYHGLYLEKYASKRVHILVQVPGCRLPVHTQFGGDERRGHNFNPNVLSFPGIVDSKGMLRFSPGAAPSLTMQLRRRVKQVVDEPMCSWVERSTPENAPMILPPGATHAYLYVVALGEEDQPPQAFGRLRLQEGLQLPAPRWKRLRLDESACNLPELTCAPQRTHVRNDFAGYILGYASIMPTVAEDVDLPIDVSSAQNPALPSSGSALSLMEPDAEDTDGTWKDVKAVDEILPQDVVLPRGTRPVSLICRPCMRDILGEGEVSIGSLGTDVRYALQQTENIKTVYCHIDMLAARSLPSSDEDGLSDPCFTIRVKDKIVQQDSNIPRSLNPTFMQRLVIPFEVEFPDGASRLSDLTENPLPPIVVKLLDADPEAFGLTTVWKEVGTAVVKHVPNLDNAKARHLLSSKTGVANLSATKRQSAGLDLNNLHTPVWHHLNDSTRRPFHEDVGGRAQHIWNQQPRLLLAAGYSMQSWVAGTEANDFQHVDRNREGFMVKLTCKEVAYHQITIDILGLRNVHPIHLPGLMKPELCVSSWWEGGPVRLKVEDLPNTNFYSSKIDADERDRFIEHMKPILDINNPEDASDDTLESEASAERNVAPVDIDRILGVRITPPIYETPVIPYLQPHGQAGGHQFVLLPDIVFQLRSKHFATDYGTVSALLRDFTQCERSWAEEAVEMRKKLPKELRGARPLKLSAVSEDSYDVCVDVFAAKAGELRWDPEVCMGRCLTQQRLFSIREFDDAISFEDEAERTPNEFGQYLNPADWMYGGGRFVDEPFDERVMPTLTCDATVEGIRKHSAPLGPKELFAEYFSSPASKMSSLQRKVNKEVRKQQRQHARKGKRHRRGSGSKRMLVVQPDDLKYMKTSDIQRAMGQAGWRAVSHLTAPERLPEAGYSVSKQHWGLENNLHTFVRPIGHVISLSERDSRFLARLKMNLPQILVDHAREEAQKKQPQKEHLRTQMIQLQKELDDLIATASDSNDPSPRRQRRAFLEKRRVGLQKKLDQLLLVDEGIVTFQEVGEHYVNYLIIKFRRPGHVIWAPPVDVNSWSTVGTPLFVVKVKGSDDVVTVTLPNFDMRFHFETAWYLRKTLVNRWRNLEKRIRRHERRKTEHRKGPKVSSKWERKMAEQNASQISIQSDQTAGAIPNRISAQIDSGTDVELAEPQGAGKSMNQTGSEDNHTDSDMECGKSHKYSHDGYSQPVRVAKNAFVCRLQKRRGNHKYDRAQTNNWYHSVLCEAFPEVAEKGDADEHEVKSFFTSRFMNLRRNLVLGEQNKETGLIKGHISVKRMSNPPKAPTIANITVSKVAAGRARRLQIQSDSVDARTSPRYPRPQAVHKPGAATDPPLTFRSTGATSMVEASQQKSANARQVDFKSITNFADDQPEYETTQPIEHLWVSSELNVNLYVLTGRNLSLLQHNTLQFYTTAEIIGGAEGGEAQVSPVTDGMDPQKPAVNFYHHFKMRSTVPGNTTLRVQVYQKGFPNVLHNHLVGTVHIDLEDRWLTLLRRRLQTSSSQEYLRRHASKSECSIDQESLNAPLQRQRSWTEPMKPQLSENKDDDGGIRIRQYIAPPPQLPIEIKKLSREDADTDSEISSGFLRLWLDLTPAGEPYWDAMLQTATREFEVRITIWGITGISIYKDFGERNDVFVRGELSHQDYLGRDISQTMLTDTHKWARTEANFNWSWKFPVTAPAAFCMLELSIMDEDMVVASEPIYDPKVLPLDHMLMLAINNCNNGRPNLSVSQEKVIFDAWPKDADVEYESDCWCCLWWCIKAFLPNCCVRLCFCCRRRLPPPTPAVMRLDVEILPKQDAERKPFQVGQIRPPKDRVSWSYAVSDPGGFIKLALGDTNSRNVMCCSCCILSTFFLVLVLVIIYLLNNSFPDLPWL